MANDTKICIEFELFVDRNATHEEQLSLKTEFDDITKKNNIFYFGDISTSGKIQKMIKESKKSAIRTYRIKVHVSEIISIRLFVNKVHM